MPDAQTLGRSRHCVSLSPVKIGLASLMVHPGVRVARGLRLLVGGMGVTYPAPSLIRRGDSMSGEERVF